jgi:hypothetical protein
MLPSLVIKIEKHWSLQQNAVKFFRQGPFFLTEFLSERNFSDAQPPNSRPLVRPGFRPLELAKYGALAARKRGDLANWSPTSNRFWVKNRSYRKQIIKHFLTGPEAPLGSYPRGTRRAKATASFHLKICPPLSLSLVSLHLNMRCSTSDALRRCKMGRLKAR